MRLAWHLGGTQGAIIEDCSPPTTMRLHALCVGKCLNAPGVPVSRVSQQLCFRLRWFGSAGIATATICLCCDMWAHWVAWWHCVSMFWQCNHAHLMHMDPYPGHSPSMPCFQCVAPMPLLACLAAVDGHPPDCSASGSVAVLHVPAHACHSYHPCMAYAATPSCVWAPKAELWVAGTAAVACAGSIGGMQCSLWRATSVPRPGVPPLYKWRLPGAMSAVNSLTAGVNLAFNTTLEVRPQQLETDTRLQTPILWQTCLHVLLQHNRLLEDVLTHSYHAAAAAGVAARAVCHLPCLQCRQQVQPTLLDLHRWGAAAGTGAEGWRHTRCHNIRL
jgi:hypothetical protein